MSSSTTEPKAESLTIEEAYAAMFEFLRQYYASTGADEVGALLGGLSLLADGQPADPGLIQDWRTAVAEIMKARESGRDVNTILQLDQKHE